MPGRYLRSKRWKMLKAIGQRWSNTGTPREADSLGSHPMEH